MLTSTIDLKKSILTKLSLVSWVCTRAHGVPILVELVLANPTTAGTFLGAPTAHGGLPGDANLGRPGAIPSITQRNRPGATGYSNSGAK